MGDACCRRRPNVSVSMSSVTSYAPAASVEGRFSSRRRTLGSLRPAGTAGRPAVTGRHLTQLYRMPAQGGIVSSTSGSGERSTGRTVLAVLLGIIALLFIVVAIIYLAEPAKSLPSFLGHINGSSGHQA